MAHRNQSGAGARIVRPPPCSITRRSYPGEVGPGAIHPSPPRGTEGSNPTLGSFGRSKNARDSAILGDQINEFCPRFCPRRKAIKDPGWCGLDAPGQQFIHRPRTWRYPRLHPACSQAARQGRARAPQSTMTKVGKSHSKGTFAGRRTKPLPRFPPSRLFGRLPPCSPSRSDWQASENP